MKKAPVHQVFLREHETRTGRGEFPKGRTLFVTNLPVDTTASDLRRIFRPCGLVKEVRFDQKSVTTEEEEEEGEGKALRRLHSPGSTAHLIFLETDGLVKALSLSSEPKKWTAGAKSITPSTADQAPLGLDRYRSIYQSHRPSPAQLQAKADAYIVEYTRRKKEEEAKIAAKFNVPDEDGFITVTRTNRRGTATDGTTTVSAARLEDVKHLKPKQRIEVNFYSFQQREAKRDKLVELRRKFEEDKAKIAGMRATRKFNPY
ncbi:ribosomal RNA-processing protein 7-domain-containing protein [Piptocephalis cylindrospora]|uniref:Ribosomal RNA-processing protein 7-domain-containing protein n=1 Tax=Piptocephalis cylindrospora TaxID=1907219 RepID=A0A4P9XYX1_9FUNG|nr:ribosomal RNA-processing protein 7-domain-containing protein [Piptocephalis cylindrospora]|eukprot:RKP11658.1 ribosomal RNA-processing protein 7-domain-containing protein [Piptocephalis cylindrospora]